MKENEKITKLSTIYKIFADPTRLRIISELLNKEINVNDLSKKLKMSQSAVSHQLQLLRLNRIVVCKRIGKIINYSIINNKIKNIIENNLKILSEVNENEQLL